MGIGLRLSCFVVLNVLFILCTSTWSCFCRNSTLFCREEERLALLEFKQSLRSEPLGLLQSWEMEDCCGWTGVACDPKTGHVTKLELLPLLYSDKPFSSYELSPSISKLRYLTHLDLSGFEISSNALIPQFIGSMKQLRYLNVTNVGFTGIIPSYLGNLVHLKVLDLQESGYSYSYGYYDPMLLIDPQWISGLRSLKYLDMSGLQLGKERNLFKVLGELPSLTHLVLLLSGINNSHLSRAGGLQNHSSFANLQYLGLSYNKFQGQIPSNVVQNIPSLIYLDLSYNHFDSFESPFPLSPNLRHLDISANQFRGQIPGALQNMTSLTYLDLSWNSFTSIPMWFTSLKSLAHLDLGYNSLNHIEGGFLTLIRGKCNLKSLKVNHNRLLGEMGERNSTVFCAFSLEEVDASNSNLEGNLPDWLWNLTNLRYLSLSNNRLQGVISESLGRLRSLQRLDLAWNQLSGPIPQSLGDLSELQLLYLSGNSMEGIVSEVHLSNLFKLKELDLSDNNLVVRLRDDWVPPFQLSEIFMRSCRFEVEFPIWVQTQMSANIIDLSNASISGDMPGWPDTGMALEYLYLPDNQITGLIPKFPSSLSFLDLSHNQIIGQIPTLPQGLYFLDLSGNQISGWIPPNMGIEIPLLSLLFLNDNHLTGPIPASLCALENLFEIDLSNNKLSGPIPDYWEISTSINIINWSSNNISGHIPSSIGKLNLLVSLLLNNNSLEGELPTSLGSLKYLEFLDLAENKFSGHLSTWIGDNILKLQILSLRQNQFSGEIPMQFCLLSQLHILDLAANYLVGTIPPCFRNISGMTQGYARKKEYQSNVRMTEAPKGIMMEYTTNLKYLNYLDLSVNKLVGMIPEELTRLTGLMALNLSHNLLLGNIPEKIGDMSMLESLDVSNNLLSGTIPQGISTLTKLSHLNLSNNNFSGRIPKGKQLDTLSDHSICAGNPLLCGDPLQKRCPGDQVAETPMSSVGEKVGNISNSSDKVILCGVRALGFVTGFWVVIGALVLRKDWRAAYFRFAEETLDSVCVAVIVKVAKIKRRMNGCYSSSGSVQR